MTRRTGAGQMGAPGLATITGLQESLTIMELGSITFFLIIMGQDSGMTLQMPLIKDPSASTNQLQVRKILPLALDFKETLGETWEG